MNAINPLDDLDFTTVTEADFENLTIDDLLGNALSDVDLSSGLPDGTFVGYISKLDIKAKGADIEKEKKGNVALAMQIKVLRCVSCQDSSVDIESLANRTHQQRFWLHVPMGKQQIAKLILGISGISFRDKKAISEVGSNMGAILEQLREERVPFGFQIKNREDNGFESSDIVFSEKALMDMHKAAELLG